MLRACQLVLASDISKGTFFFNLWFLCKKVLLILTFLCFQANGIYTIAKLILPNKERNAEKTSLLQVTPFIIIAH